MRSVSGLPNQLLAFGLSLTGDLTVIPNRKTNPSWAKHLQRVSRTKTKQPMLCGLQACYRAEPLKLKKTPLVTSENIKRLVLSLHTVLITEWFSWLQGWFSREGSFIFSPPRRLAGAWNLYLLSCLREGFNSKKMRSYLERRIFYRNGWLIEKGRTSRKARYLNKQVGCWYFPLFPSRIMSD